MELINPGLARGQHTTMAILQTAGLVRRALVVAVLCLSLFCYLEKLGAEEAAVDEVPPDRYGMGLLYGNTFSPGSDIGFVQVSGFGLFDYAKVWHHPAPKLLRWKLEGTIGSTTMPQARFMASLGMLALYYLDFISTNYTRPYIEGGIGGIYTDFQVKGQGSRINFNPQAGLGMDVTVGPGLPFYVAARVHHISNAGLNHNNKGVNSVIFMLGRYFK
jgi:lipid A 3-O-deacylase